MPFSSPKIKDKAFERQHCSTCDRDFSEMAKFCDECGSTLKTVEGPVVQLYRTPEPSPLGVNLVGGRFPLESPINPSPSAATVFHVGMQGKNLMCLDNTILESNEPPKKSIPKNDKVESKQEENDVGIKNVSRQLGIKGVKGGMDKKVSLKKGRLRFFNKCMKKNWTKKGAPPSPAQPSRAAPLSPCTGTASVRTELRKLKLQLEGQKNMIAGMDETNGKECRDSTEINR